MVGTRQFREFLGSGIREVYVPCASEWSKMFQEYWVAKETVSARRKTWLAQSRNE